MPAMISKHVLLPWWPPTNTHMNGYCCFGDTNISFNFPPALKLTISLKLNKVNFWRLHDIRKSLGNDIRYVFLLSCKKRDVKIVSEKCQPFCLGIIVLTKTSAFKLISYQPGGRRWFGIKWNTITWLQLTGLISWSYIYPCKITAT